MKKTVLLKLLFICGLMLLPLDIISGKNCFASNSASELFMVSQKAFEDGFYDVAIRYIKQLLNDFPESEQKTEARLLLGQCYFFKSQYLKAYDIFQNVLKSQKLQDATHYWLGETYLKGTDYSQAEKEYLEIIQYYPDSIYMPQALYSLAWVYYEKGEFKKAKDTFEKLLKKYPDYQFKEDAFFKTAECDYNLGNFDTAINTFSQFIQNYPNSTRISEANFYIAESYYYQNDSLTAITFYAKVAENSYDNKLILMSEVSMGWSYLKLGKYDLSRKHFEAALNFAETKGLLTDDIYFGLANLYTETKEYEKALQAYADLIENFPKSKRILESLLGRANIHYRQRNYTQAVRNYRAIIDKLSGSTENNEILEKAYFGLAWSYLKAGNLYLAVKNFETIKDQTENKTVKISALTQIGDAYQDSDKLDQAIGIYDQILKDYPESPYTDYVQFRQGIALLKMDKIEAATLSFHSLEANFPNSKYLTDVKYYLAVAYFKKGDWSAAKEQSQAFLEKQKDYSEFTPESYYILALSEFNLNEYKNAINDFRHIVKNFKDQNGMVRTSQLNIAKSFYHLKDIKEALKQFKSIIDLYPDSEAAQESFIWLGDYYLKNSDLDNAISYYNNFLNKFPGSKKKNIVLYHLGQTYQLKREFTKAINALKKVESDDPALSANAKLAIADIFSTELDQEKAIETYQSIIKSSPEYTRDAYVEIAKVHKKLKEYSDSLKAYQMALGSKKGLSEITDAEIEFYLGDNYELLNQNDAAIEQYFKIPYLYATETAWVTKAYLRIARIFEDGEKWKEAKKIYNKVIALKTAEEKFAKERIAWINEHIKE